MNEENKKIKEKLFSLYNNIKLNIPLINLENILSENIIEDFEAENSLNIISKINNLIQFIIDSKNLETKVSIENGESNIETINYNNNKIIFDYNQIKEYMKKLEADNRFLMKKIFQQKVQKTSLENKVNALLSIEEEYEQLKEKVKYENGKFLDNDRKDNEIIILRRENSSLKKEITKMEIKDKQYESKIQLYQTKIQQLEQSIETLNTKIYNLEKLVKNKSVKNKHIRKSNNNSSVNLRLISNENFINKNKMSEHDVSNLKNIIQVHNDNNKKLLPCFNSKIINTFNNNIFTATYNRIVNGTNNKKIIIPIKKEFSLLKRSRNNSTNILKVRETDEINTFSFKKNRGKMDKFYQSNQKNKNFIVNPKPHYIYPLSCKNDKDGKIIRKFIQKDLKKNNSSINILINQK